MKVSPPSRSAVARQLLAYWADHPGAQGTVEEIVEWWVLEQRLREAVCDVQGALNELVKGGLINQGQHLDGRTIYRLNRNALDRN